MNALSQYRNIHFIGVGGIGMSAIALILLEKGFVVSGSDLGSGSTTERLIAHGARIQRGHAAENIAGADLVVTSTAIRPDNPELVAARAQGVTVWRRARVLAEIMRGGRGIAVSGTHGKTTTTSMAGLALVEAGLDPTVVVGGEVDAFGGNALLGRGEWVVAEADESDASFLDMDPDRIIVTNIEEDHLDHYRDIEHLIDTFCEFAGRMREGGQIIACIDNEGVRRMLGRVQVPALTYSLTNPAADLTARNIRYYAKEGGLGFTPILRGEALPQIKLGIPGHQNVSNALSVLLLALNLGCDPEAVGRALVRYKGAKRRFQIKGVAHGITVIDDYAHHPTEIMATLAAARSTVRQKKDRRIVGIFQPHRYSRTASLAAEFGRAFREADLMVFTDVYGAGEDPIDGVDGALIHRNVVADGHRSAHYVAKTADVIDFLRPILNEGDTVFTLGAGDIWRTGERLLAALRGGEGAASGGMFQPAALSR